MKPCKNGYFMLRCIYMKLLHKIKKDTSEVMIRCNPYMFGFGTRFSNAD